MRQNEPLRPQGHGLQVIGPGFYLWEPDASEALRLAAELRRRPTRAPARPRRLVLRGPAAS